MVGQNEALLDIYRGGKGLEFTVFRCPAAAMGLIHFHHPAAAIDTRKLREIVMKVIHTI
jgi:hypothetical protein